MKIKHHLHWLRGVRSYKIKIFSLNKWILSLCNRRLYKVQSFWLKLMQLIQVSTHLFYSTLEMGGGGRREIYIYISTETESEGKVFIISCLNSLTTLTSRWQHCDDIFFIHLSEFPVTVTNCVHKSIQQLLQYSTVRNQTSKSYSRTTPLQHSFKTTLKIQQKC